MSQKEKIKKHLVIHGSITPLKALSKYGCFRLSARILELKRDGMAINMKMVTRGKKTFARYTCG